MIDIKIQVNPKYTFDNYIVGDCNKTSCMFLKSVISEQVTSDFNPIIINSVFGLGKTHLLQAFYNDMTRKHEHLKVLYLKAFEFIQLFVNSVKYNETNDLQSELLEFDIFVLDDFDQFSNKDQTQNFLTNIIDFYIDNGKQVVIATSTNIINDCSFDPRLSSKLTKGVEFKIDIPDKSTVSSFIQSKLKQLNFTALEDKIQELANVDYVNFNELEGAIKSIKIKEKYSLI